MAGGLRRETGAGSGAVSGQCLPGTSVCGLTMVGDTVASCISEERAVCTDGGSHLSALTSNHPVSTHKNTSCFHSTLCNCSVVAMYSQR